MCPGPGRRHVSRTTAHSDSTSRHRAGLRAAGTHERGGEVLAPPSPPGPGGCCGGCNPDGDETPAADDPPVAELDAAARPGTLPAARYARTAVTTAAPTAHSVRSCRARARPSSRCAAREVC
jgi:hypothetical protein